MKIGTRPLELENHRVRVGFRPSSSSRISSSNSSSSSSTSRPPTFTGASYATTHKSCFRMGMMHFYYFDDVQDEARNCENSGPHVAT